MSTTIDRGAPASGKSGSGLRGSHAVRWWVLVVLGMAQLMVMLDATVVNIALPEAQQDLGFSDGSRQWVITGYALAFGSLLLLGGRLGDLWGRRTLFVIGLAGFGAASVLGGSASSFEIFVAARVAQGLFAAVLAPAALSLLSVTFPDSTSRSNTPTVEVLMGRQPGWMVTQTGRPAMRSPGRPPIRREVEQAFWRKIAEGMTSEDAGIAVGVSGPVAVKSRLTRSGCRGTPCAGRVVRTRLVRRAPSMPSALISLATWSRPTSYPALPAAFHSFRAP